MIVIGIIVAVYFGLGAIFAISGAIDEGLSGLRLRDQIGLAAATVLLWPVVFVPDRRSDDNSIVATTARKRQSILDFAKRHRRVG
jgi:hypothetical protein